MNGIKRFRDGLNVGLYSFGFLWKHKQLILYLSIPKLAGMLFELTKHNLFFVSPIRATLVLRRLLSRFLYTFDGMQDIMIILVQMVTILVTTFAAVALTIHTFSILKKRKTGIKRSLKKTIQKIRPIVWWTLITTVVYFLIAQLDKLAKPCIEPPCHPNFFLGSLGIFARMVWSIPFLFVITLIALEDQSIKKTMMKSWSMLKQLVWYYLGAMFWVVLIAALGVAPLYFIYPQQLSQYGISASVLLLVTLVTTTTHAVVKTVLYQRYVE